MMGILEGGELINVREYDGVVGAGEQDGIFEDDGGDAEVENDGEVLFLASLNSFILDLAHGLNVLTVIISVSRSNIRLALEYNIHLFLQRNVIIMQ